MFVHIFLNEKEPMGQKARTLFGPLWYFTINQSKTKNQDIYLNIYSLAESKT